jgi:nitroimidazol reductase NimA-like FMN-containing flavoprotein (pyridoxamine 5'-phosphate oxidase superfamily)
MLIEREGKMAELFKKTNQQDRGSFDVSSRNRITRVPGRARYDRETVFGVLDAALICHVGIASEGGITVIPMFHARLGDELIFHGATTSRLLRYLGSGKPVCIAAAIVDGIVLARSLFHHSINYRSVVVFGTGRLIESAEELNSAACAVAEKVMPGRWLDARPPNDQELKATSFVAVRMESASAKVRVGGPVDEEKDYQLPHWAGVVPLQVRAGDPVPDERLPADLPVPDYIDAFIKRTLMCSR